VARLGLNFIQAIGVRGPSYVEFKRDERDGTWKLLECNHRFTVEFDSFHPDAALLAFRRALGQPCTRPQPRYSRTYQWNPEPDVRALISYWRRGVLSPLSWLRSFRRPLHLHVFRWDDPLPTLGYNASRALGLLKRWCREALLKSRSAGPPSEPHEEFPGNPLRQRASY
jgi:D-aspartate ligase